MPLDLFLVYFSPFEIIFHFSLALCFPGIQGSLHSRVNFIQVQYQLPLQISHFPVYAHLTSVQLSLNTLFLKLHKVHSPLFRAYDLRPLTSLPETHFQRPCCESFSTLARLLRPTQPQALTGDGGFPVIPSSPANTTPAKCLSPSHLDPTSVLSHRFTFARETFPLLCGLPRSHNQPPSRFSFGHTLRR